MIKALLFISLLFLANHSNAQSVEEINLYTSIIPGSKPSSIKEHFILVNGTRRIYSVTNPTLTKFQPANSNGIAVIICPGGGYVRLSIDNEGEQVAKVLNEKGITAFVLKYRLPNDTIEMDKSMAPLQDLQAAIQLVRKNASAWKILPNKIGVMGFSAGGHLASSATVHFNVKTDKTNTDTTSTRPDFAALIYPVINFSPRLVHQGSMDNLLGPNPSKEQLDFFSTDLNIPNHCPPVFLVHAQDDNSVPVANSLHFYEACTTKKVPAEMHLYPNGGHGFGLENTTTKDSWIERFFNWVNGL